MRVINSTPVIYGGEDNPTDKLSAAPGSIYICECGDVFIKAGSLSMGTEGWVQIREGDTEAPPLLAPESAGGAAEVATQEEVEEQETAEDLVNSNTKEELLSLAELENVEVNPDDTKLVIAEAIVAARAGG